MLNLNATVQVFNEAAENLFRFRREEAVGKNIGELLKIDFGNDEKYRTFTDIIGIKNRWQGEISVYSKDKTKLYIKLDIEPVTDQNGDITSIICVFIDITDSKENENKLHLLSNVILHASDGIVVTDLYDNIIFINSSYG